MICPIGKTWKYFTPRSMSCVLCLSSFYVLCPLFVLILCLVSFVCPRSMSCVLCLSSFYVLCPLFVLVLCLVSHVVSASVHYRLLLRFSLTLSFCQVMPLRDRGTVTTQSLLVYFLFNRICIFNKEIIVLTPWCEQHPINLDYWVQIVLQPYNYFFWERIITNINGFIKPKSIVYVI